jgi:periplasmic protein TonB
VGGAGDPFRLLSTAGTDTGACDGGRVAGSNKIVGKITGRFNAFLLASVCLHAGLLLTLVDAEPLPGHRETVLSIHLVGLEQATTPSAAIAPPRRSAPAAAASGRIARATTTAATAPTLPDRAATSAPDTGEAAAAPDRLRAQVQSQLLAHLDPYFKKHYPRLAQRYGWQGQVLLAFTVMPDGELERVQVAQSSGYDVLDRAAISSLQRFGNRADVAQWLNGKALDIKLPVIYRLTDY